MVSELTDREKMIGYIYAFAQNPMFNKLSDETRIATLDLWRSINIPRFPSEDISPLIDLFIVDWNKLGLQLINRGKNFMSLVGRK